MNSDSSELLIDEVAEPEDFGGPINEYDITATPNDFNVMTINSFIDSGAIVIPGFQRNYVWDIKKASKLIESLLLGLPVPQLYLYESDKNKFLVIDGQQRMMSVYYFIKNRFPRKEKRAEIRRLFAEHEGLPDYVLQDDEYFVSFKLSLNKKSEDKVSKFHGLNYSTLDDYRSQFDLRPIRNIIVKQNSPNDDSSIYEIFNRLNSGGVNLRPQEIRACLYHSSFYTMLGKLNYDERWRNILKMKNLDLHMKDVELLLRCFAMGERYRSYKPSLANFLNTYSKDAKKYDATEVDYRHRVFSAFLDRIEDIDPELFVNQKSRRFNIFLFEALFAASTNTSFSRGTLELQRIEAKVVKSVAEDVEFQEASIAGTTNTTNVFKRFDVAERHLKL